MTAPGARPVNYELLWSEEAKLQQPASLSGLLHRFLGQPDLIGMHGGLPPGTTFPLASLQGSGEQLSNGGFSVVAAQMYDAQQYNFNPAGYPPLVQWLQQLTEAMQKPLIPVEVAITNGAVHAISIGTSLLLNPGDFLLIEEYTYTHALECCFLPKALKLLPVRMDSGGLDVSHLQQVLKDHAAAGLPRPRVLYTVPSGQNPTSVSMSSERKAQLYAACQEADVMILEDDAYTWLQYPTGQPPPGLALPSSLLSIDTDGRVLRIDTFAKVLGPGYRLGWVTASPVLVKKIAAAVMGNTVGASTFTQVVVHSMLQPWGLPGFGEYVRRLQVLYAQKAAEAHEAAQQHLAGLAEWQPAQAGMFMWFRILSGADPRDLLDDMVQSKVVVVPGAMFAADRKALAEGVKVPFFRVSFASCPKEDLQAGFERLRGVLLSAASRIAGEPDDVAKQQ